ncbi:MAG: molybdopterin-dependent oxidoreductase [Comamonadaceae bacterium]|nr:molybdopterin-dependent oxidoreductase [Comamonadaceae bacterium]
MRVGRRRGAGGHLRRQGRHARRALRREPADPDLGQQPDRRRTCTSGPSRSRPSARGAKLVCIDPRRTETAEKCHQHIALLPGTDGALALGADARADRATAGSTTTTSRATSTAGRALRERALQWPPERAAAVCGIDADEVARPGARLRHARSRRRSA